jgi:cysteine desulfuration protein SufE
MPDLKNADMNIPNRLQEIIEDFQACKRREKVELLLEYSEKLPPLPAWLKDCQDHMDKVEECMIPVFVFAEQTCAGMFFHFDIPAESPTIRGFAALLCEGLDGASPHDILQVPADFFTRWDFTRS